MQIQEKKETILHFIDIKDETMKLSKLFNNVKLDKAGIIYDFKDSNDLKIYIELKENCIYYYETLIFTTKDKSEISLDYPIYINKINNIYVSNNAKQISLEVLYQTVKIDLLPKNIYYDNKELTSFDTFKNKFRKRIGLINIDPKKLSFFNDIHEQYPNFEFENETPYQILARIPINGQTQYSISNCEFNNNNVRIKTNKKTIQFDKIKIYDSLLKFKKDYYSTFINDSNLDIENAKKKIDDLNNKYNYLKIEAKYYYDNILNYSDFNNIDIDIFILMFKYLILLEIKEIKDEYKGNIKFISKLACISEELNETYEKYMSNIKELNIDIKDKLLLLKSYNKKFIDSLRSGDKIFFLKTLIFEKEKINNPYVKALNFIKEIILNLKEESRLFEIFLYLDSDVIENLLINREEYNEKFIDFSGRKIQIDFGKNPTEYGINLSNLDEIKSHLYKLIPKYIVRIETDMKFNANYDAKSKIMFLNEKRLFNDYSNRLSKIFDDNEENENYILPIVIEILHELFDHGKKRLIDDKANSPEEYRDSKHNYQRCQVRKKNDNSKIVNYRESGVVLENYISENRDILRWMKEVHENNIGKNLLDASLWVAEDFSKLENLVENYISLDKDNKYKKISKFDTVVHSNDEDIIDFYIDDDTCGFHIFEY